jgi:alginate production protein
LAQFQLPPAPPREGTGPAQQDARKMVMPAALTFQYAIGSDTETTVLKNPDLNGRNGDDSVFVAPNMFGLFIYRPNAWLEGTLEMTLERMIALQREPVVTMPDGSSQQAEELRWSLLVDQIYATAKDLGPFELSVGRRNFEDPRLWLYDAALDTVFAKVRLGDVHTELSVSRENYFDGELLYDVPISVRGRTDNRILYMEYRGIEDHKMAAYAIKRIDYTGSEGRPLHTGVRAYGSPTDSFRYWSELGFSLNHDASNDKLSGFGFDLGATYRFMDHPLQPTITLGYSFGSGDADETDNVNREFRQTGLQSNEGRFGGVTQFKRYGEFLDPELSNLNILTAGFSFRPAPNAFVDLVYHRYRLDEYAIELRSSGVTALMNQDPTRLTKEVGQEVDLIIGFRNLFGLRRFGFEARIGYFLPGDAYRIPESYPDNPPFRKANTGVSGLFVIII